MARVSRSTVRAFNDTECDISLLDIWEGDEIGWVDGEKACEECWAEAGGGEEPE